MFTLFYELFIGHLPSPTYRNSIFTPVGWITLLGISLGTALLFYAFLGRWRPIFHRRGHWIFTLILVMLVSFGLAVWFALDTTHSIKTDSYMIGFGFENLVLSGLLFFMFSLLLRKVSDHARSTPF